MVPCVSLKWKLTVSNHIWSVCAQKSCILMFWIIFLSLSFAPTTFIFAGYFPALFPSLEIIFKWLRNIILVSTVDMTSERLCWPVTQISLFILQFLVTGQYLELFSFRVLHYSISPVIYWSLLSRHEWFSLKSFFHDFFSHLLNFVFPRWRWVGNWSFFLNFVGSEYWCDMIEGLQCASVCRVVNAWCRFCFLCIFFSKSLPSIQFSF